MRLSRRFTKYSLSAFLLAWTLTACSNMNLLMDLTSPDKQLTAHFAMPDDGDLTYSLCFGEDMILQTSRLGYLLPDSTCLPASEWRIAGITQTNVDTVWHPVWGKRAEVKDCYNQMIISLQSRNDSAAIRKMDIELRMYNDGMAFRYCFPKDNRETPAVRELTEYNFTSDPVAWFYNGENANYGPVSLSEVDAIRPVDVTLKLSDSCYVNLNEACLDEGDPLQLQSKGGHHTFTVASSPGVFGKLKGGYQSGWRVIMTARTPGGLVDSHLTELLNPDPEMDFSWVKPGVALWDWRINGAQWQGFTYSMSYPSWTRMIDFAAKEGFGYLVLDANWYGPEFAKDSDPLQSGKVKEVMQLLSYAKERGVGVWLYLNDVGGKSYPIEKTLKQYHDWGAAGVKYGFMQGTPEEKNLWTRKITKLCAENHLLVDFHDGPVHPYGQMRTWPNAVAREYCHAQLDAHRVFTPSTFCTTVFVNMVAGPLDMNNGMFDLRQGKTTRIDENQPVPSTVVSEAARTLIVFSGATILPDIPEYYNKYPELLSFIASEKMPWKESRTLSGEIGQYIVMARKTNTAWLIGAATNEQPRTLEVPLDFLKDQKDYHATIIEDGEGANYLTNRESYKVRLRVVNRNSILKLTLAAGGGACVILSNQEPRASSGVWMNNLEE